MAVYSLLAMHAYVVPTFSRNIVSVTLASAAVPFVALACVCAIRHRRAIFSNRMLAHRRLTLAKPWPHNHTAGKKNAALTHRAPTGQRGQCDERHKRLRGGYTHHTLNIPHTVSSTKSVGVELAAEREVASMVVHDDLPAALTAQSDEAGAKIRLNFVRVNYRHVV